MGYIYEVMDMAKEAIAKSFSCNESRYGEIFKLIDNRWNIQLHCPLHGARWYSNLEFFYNTRTVDGEVTTGLFTCIERLVLDVETRCKIDVELAKYKRTQELFGSQMVVRMKGLKLPVSNRRFLSSLRSQQRISLSKMKFVKEPFNLFKQALKLKASERGRFICLDVRDDFVGMSMSDVNNKNATPARALIREKSSLESVEDQFHALLPQNKLAGLVFGIRDNNDEKAKIFIDELYETGTPRFKTILDGVTYTYWDTSSSSTLPEYVNKEKVEMLLQRMNLPNIKAETVIEQYVAAGMLQSYLKRAWELYPEGNLEVTVEKNSV
ncbi:hypothetical protein LWI28_015540 [Acer negundo]|uniref:Uncharacterized protein n=1 Tax=Acer negundo TaxID=4023 RepID=A0AAD5I9Q3_ACENE|nr:hypothetical protein LWI28_015540 [Acer negundo]